MKKKDDSCNSTPIITASSTPINHFKMGTDSLITQVTFTPQTPITKYPIKTKNFI